MVTTEEQAFDINTDALAAVLAALRRHDIQDMAGRGAVASDQQAAEEGL